MLSYVYGTDWKCLSLESLEYWEFGLRYIKKVSEGEVEEGQGESGNDAYTELTPEHLKNEYENEEMGRITWY